jgi:hypothetical protein
MAAPALYAAVEAIVEGGFTGGLMEKFRKDGPDIAGEDP